MKRWIVTQTQPGIWVYTWTPTPGHIYEVWLTGVLQHTTASGVGAWSTDEIDAAMPPPVEIHDTADGVAQSEAYPPRAILQWRGTDGAAGYVVEQLFGDWLVVDTFTERSVGWYTYRTGVLADRVAGNFRVTALEQRGLGGTNVEFNVILVCNPTPPVITPRVSSGTLTVEVA